MCLLDCQFLRYTSKQIFVAMEILMSLCNKILPNDGFFVCPFLQFLLILSSKHLLVGNNTEYLTLKKVKLSEKVYHKSEIELEMVSK